MPVLDNGSVLKEEQVELLLHWPLGLALGTKVASIPATKGRNAASQHVDSNEEMLSSNVQKEEQAQGIDSKTPFRTSMPPNQPPHLSKR